MQFYWSSGFFKRGRLEPKGTNVNVSMYDRNYYSGNGQDADRPALHFYTRLAKLYFQPGRVLDFGSGTGHFLKRLSQHFEVDGFEISEHGLACTRILVPDVRLYTTPQELPSSSYSGITALHVLEHIADEELASVFSAWRRALRPGGRVLCVVPERDGRGHRLKCERWSAFGDPSHINLKPRGEWKTVLSEHGFRVVKSGTDGLWDFPYRDKSPLLLDLPQFAPGTLLQFLAGRLILREGQGESLILLLESE